MNKINFRSITIIMFGVLMFSTHLMVALNSSDYTRSNIKDDTKVVSDAIVEISPIKEALKAYAEELPTPDFNYLPTADKQLAIDWQKVDDLVDEIDKYWAGSILEGKGKYLVDWCKSSEVPRVCVKVIAVQTKWETGFGEKGQGLKRKNLTGIRCHKRLPVEEGYCDKNANFMVYKQYQYSLKDSVELFKLGYDDLFTKYTFQTALSKHLKIWGTNQYNQVLKDILEI